MQLGQRMADGASLREHLQSAARQTGDVDPRLLSRLPAHGTGLWEAFASLSASRPVGLNNAASIPPADVLAWQQLHGVQLTGWEIDTLAAMDRAALAVVAEIKAKQ